MPANWTVLKVEPNNGLVKVTMSRDGGPHGQEEVVHFHVVPKAFGREFMVGDMRDALNFALVGRAGENGKT